MDKKELFERTDRLFWKWHEHLGIEIAEGIFEEIEKLVSDGLTPTEAAKAIEEATNGTIFESIFRHAIHMASNEYEELEDF